MEGSQTVLTPPPGMIEKGGKGAKTAPEEPKVFNFDRSYWSFDRSDSHYGQLLQPGIQWTTES